jgi:hypothetical protein
VKAVRAHRGGGPEYLFIEAAPLPKIRRGNVLLCKRAWHHARGTALTRDATYQNADGRPRIPGFRGMKFRRWRSARRRM